MNNSFKKIYYGIQVFTRTHLKAATQSCCFLFFFCMFALRCSGMYIKHSILEFLQYSLNFSPRFSSILTFYIFGQDFFHFALCVCVSFNEKKTKILISFCNFARIIQQDVQWQSYVQPTSLNTLSCNWSLI